MTGKNVRKEESHAAWNLKDIREILDLLNEQGISEFELENNGFRVRIKRGPDAQVGQVGQVGFDGPQSAAATVQTPHFGIVHPVQRSSHSATSPAGASAHASAADALVDPHASLHMIKSPIVGTFYSAPGPDTPPFVKVGDEVQPGKVLCIIEAMKLMNEIEAEVAGEIARIFVENGQPVEYGQALFGVVLPAPGETE
ncbi:MAG: acetyl-CoA carboxylase biotin carboxyl carrier protein [Terriglobia bacterium]